MPQLEGSDWVWEKISPSEDGRYEMENEEE